MEYAISPKLEHLEWQNTHTKHNRITGSCSHRDKIKIISSFPEVAFHFRNYINIITNWDDTQCNN